MRAKCKTKSACRCLFETSTRRPCPGEVDVEGFSPRMACRFISGTSPVMVAPTDRHHPSLETARTWRLLPGDHLMHNSSCGGRTVDIGRCRRAAKVDHATSASACTSTLTTRGIISIFQQQSNVGGGNRRVARSCFWGPPTNSLFGYHVSTGQAWTCR